MIEYLKIAVIALLVILVAKFLLNLFSPINCRSLLIFSFILQTFNLMLVDIVNMDLDGIAKRLETIQSNLDILQSAFTNQFVKHDEGGLSLSASDSALSDFTMSSEFAFRNIILQKLPPSTQAAVQRKLSCFGRVSTLMIKNASKKIASGILNT